METTPLWRQGEPLPVFPQLDHELEVDVVAIGGGATGITAAYLFKHHGLRVALLERDRFPAGDTAHTTAHVTCVNDRPLQSLVRVFGRDHARAVCDAGAAARDNSGGRLHCSRPAYVPQSA